MEEQGELAALRDSIRDVLRTECTAEHVQGVYATGTPLLEPLWRTAGELGWLGIAIAEAQGGLGLGMDALAVLYEELGAVVAPIPVLPTLLAADLIARAGNSAQRAAWLPDIAAGSIKAAVSWDGALSGRVEGDALHLSGRVEEILDGGQADLLLVAIDVDGVRRRVAILPDADGIVVQVERTADQSRSLAALEVQGATVPLDRLLDAIDERPLQRHAAIAIACDAFGGASAMLDITIDYLKTREQFGRAIGSFQALKHRVAEHKAALMIAGAGITDAAARDEADTMALCDALAAKAHATTIAGTITRDCVQLHGGIGFTWEHCAHLYLKRALLNAVLFGTTAETLDAVAWELAG